MRACAHVFEKAAFAPRASTTTQRRDAVNATIIFELDYCQKDDMRRRRRRRFLLHTR